MNLVEEKRTSQKTRPTKRQFQLLKFIEDFITEHGYSPSYREIAAGLNYTSIATVALHINSLIARGHLQKRGHSARSLELTQRGDPRLVTNQVKPGEEKWLVERVEYLFVQAKRNPTEEQINQLDILIAALRILGLDGAAHSFSTRLTGLKSN